MKAVGWVFVLAAAAAGLALAVACGGPPKPPMVPDTDLPDGEAPATTLNSSTKPPTSAAPNPFDKW